MVSSVLCFVGFLGITASSFVLHPAGQRTVSPNVLFESNVGSVESGVAAPEYTKLHSPEEIARMLGPPQGLAELGLGEALCFHDSPIRIERIAFEPDMFVVRNLLIKPENRHALINQALETGLYNDETSSAYYSGQDRSNQKVAWVDESEVTEYLNGFATDMLLNEQFVAENDFSVEKVQVAHYDQGGKFETHHDGYARTLTMLTYLNDVAGTWFPFAIVDEKDKYDEPPQVTSEGIATFGKIPGRHGILLTDDERNSLNLNVVPVKAGDAVVVYNYEYSYDFGVPIMSWRALHAGMPAKDEKWIATNWVRSDLAVDQSQN